MKQKNRELAKETQYISANGRYQVKEKDIVFAETDRLQELEKATVYYPDKVCDIVGQIGQMEKFKECSQRAGNLYLLEADALLVAKEFEHPLVLSFSNPMYPGKGFLEGDFLQEESLCRASTLFSSLRSREAERMYASNRENQRDSFSSDAMILSPKVVVFRNFEMDLLEEPYEISVISVPAVDRKKEGEYFLQKHVDEVMLRRIRGLLSVAIAEGYHNLILGAWGCGYLGNDPTTVASYFKKVLLEEELLQYFDYVIFAIIDTPNKKRISAFQKVFGKTMESFLNEDIEEKSGFLQFEYPMPACNMDYTGIDFQENLGIAQGVFADGTPFQAELWVELESMSQNVTFVLPYKSEFFIEEKEVMEKEKENGESNVTNFSTTMEFVWNTLLCDGMEIVDDEVNFASTDLHVCYLISMGILQFHNEMINGIVHVLKDYAEQKVVAINICIENSGISEAIVGVNFHPFAGAVIDRATRKAQLRVIKGDEKRDINKDIY